MAAPRARAPRAMAAKKAPVIDLSSSEGEEPSEASEEEEEEDSDFE